MIWELGEANWELEGKSEDNLELVKKPKPGDDLEIGGASEEATNSES